MTAGQTEYTSDDINLLLVRTERLAIVSDDLIFSRGRPTSGEQWVEFAEDLGALLYAIRSQMTDAQKVLKAYASQMRAPERQASSTPSVLHHTTPSSTAAEKALA